MKSIILVIFSLILLPLSAWAGMAPYGCEKIIAPGKTTKFCEALS